jgi:signal peptidase II
LTANEVAPPVEVAGDGDTVPPDAVPPDASPPARPWAPPALVALVATALVALALDVVTKQLAADRLADGRAVRLLGGAVYLVLTRNSGAAFSLGQGYTVVFPVITLGVVGWIVWTARRLRSVPWAVALGLVLGGALGNLGDRLFRAPGPFLGHVVDFISVFDDAGRAFPVFNIADSALCVGVALAVLLELTGRRRDGTRVPPRGPAVDGGTDTSRAETSRAETFRADNLTGEPADRDRD